MMGCKIFLLCLIFINIICNSSCGKINVISLNENNWHQTLQDEWMVEFFAPWCPACKSLAPIWNTFSEWSRDLNINVGQVDVTKSPGLSGRFMVTALPTIFHVKNGEFRQYRGARDKEAFISFIEEKKWEEVEPIPSWKAPNSIQMSVVSWFFKLSQILRDFHNHLMLEYGVPTWGSYLIFALITIMLGALLGLILVCVIDFIYPPKIILKSNIVETKKGIDDGKIVDEILDEDIQDDLLDDVSQSDKEKQSDSEQTEESDTNPVQEAGEPESPVRKRKTKKPHPD